jgi:hypothetical protein
MDKFICNKCKFSLTIQKSTETKITKINNPTELINALNSDIYNDIELKLSKEVLDNFLSKKKQQEKTRILEYYNKISNSNKVIHKYILKCTTCGENYYLHPETIIFSLSFNKKNSTFNDSDMDLKIYDPTLPRTKDYICPNNNCETNKKNFNTVNKEAVFYRALGGYNLKYACVNCKTSWLI